MSYNQLRGLFLATAALGALIVTRLFMAAVGEEKRALLILPIDEVEAACLRSRYPLADFLERAKAIGAGAAALGVETPSSLDRRGQALFFSAAEVEKWRALGFIASGSALKPNTLWTKQPAFAEAAARAGASAGVSVSTSAVSGYRVVEFPAGFDASALALGIDPERAAMAARAGLEAVPFSPAMRSVGLDVPLARLLRSFFSSSGGSVLLRPSPNDDVEKILERLRGVSESLRGLGVVPGPASAPAVPGSRARAILFWLIAIFGPLTCARAGLRCLLYAQGYAEKRFPVASPVFEVLCGAAAALAASAVFGLVLRALGGISAHAPAGSSWPILGPLAVGAIALWAGDWPEIKKKFKGPIAYGDIAKGAAAAGLGALVLWPGEAAVFFGLGGLAAKAKDFSPAFWWWPWRWREALIGLPCLIVALFSVYEKWNCSECRPPDQAEPRRFPKDPRPWLWSALLAPIGIGAALGDAALPFGAAAGQAAIAVLLGGALIACALGSRHWKKGPPMGHIAPVR